MSQTYPQPGDGESAEPGVEARVAAAVATLDTLADIPTPAHVEVFESVHEVLSQTLSAVDEA